MNQADKPMQSDVEAAVPDDFPRPQPTLSALAGSQPKLALVLDADGQYRGPDGDVSGLDTRYNYCIALVEWGVPFILEKSRRLKYQDLYKAQLLHRFQITLAQRFELSPPEQLWIRKAVAEQLGWIDDLRAR